MVLRLTRANKAWIAILYSGTMQSIPQDKLWNHLVFAGITGFLVYLVPNRTPTEVSK